MVPEWTESRGGHDVRGRGPGKRTGVEGCIGKGRGRDTPWSGQVVRGEIGVPGQESTLRLFGVISLLPTLFNYTMGRGHCKRKTVPERLLFNKNCCVTDLDPREVVDADHPDTFI